MVIDPPISNVKKIYVNIAAFNEYNVTSIVANTHNYKMLHFPNRAPNDIRTAPAPNSAKNNNS